VSPTPALAQAFPSKPIHIILPFPPGGSSDILARALGARLSEMWKQPVVVESKAGGNGVIAGQFVAKSVPDGHTLMLGDMNLLAIVASLPHTSAFDPVKDLVPVTGVASLPFILVVHPSVPAANLDEFIAYARKNPGKLNFAASSVTLQFAGIDFAARTGIDWTYVLYKGSGPALTDMAGGHVNVMINSMTSTYPFVKSGKLKLLAVTSAKRSAIAPDVPTAMEAGVAGYESGSIQGIVAPAGTPREIINKIHADVQTALLSREMRERLATDGAEPVTKTPEAMAALMREDVARYTKFVKEGNVKVE
jgi:tripartite-type tricarboxylate transporter receptor subunit TctC